MSDGHFGFGFHRLLIRHVRRVPGSGCTTTAILPACPVIASRGPLSTAIDGFADAPLIQCAPLTFTSVVETVDKDPKH
ncbi:hypothetical protein AS032_34950 [Rhodococcus qingshengii]|nr:hypothetical protein AOT96_32325 [Rhodococcus sp. 008]KSU57585.1 hypothetical protein AS032_34950 [Rhodococcus qingshengii]